MARREHARAHNAAAAPRRTAVAAALLALGVLCAPAAASRPSLAPRSAAVLGPARAARGARASVRAQSAPRTRDPVVRKPRSDGAANGVPSRRPLRVSDALAEMKRRTGVPMDSARERTAHSVSEPAGSTDRGLSLGFLETMEPELRTNLARASVLLLTLVWATNFPVIKTIFDSGLEPPEYALIRFSVAALALLPLARWDDPVLVKGGAQCGAWVATGYMTQAIALTTASANKGAFICACQVVFVALVSSVSKRTFEAKTWVSALLALGGVGLLELAGSAQPELSDLWCLGMPVCFGMGYIKLEELMEDHPEDAVTVSALKVGVVGLVAVGWSVVRGLMSGGAGEHLLHELTAAPLPWPALLYTGLVTTAGAIVVESFAFKYVPATDAAVILASEPLWAALVAWQMVGEQLTPKEMVGGLLIISACVYNQLASDTSDAAPEDDHLPAPPQQ